MSWTQAIRNRAVTITTKFLTDETVETPDGAVAVLVKDSAGTTVSSGNASVSGTACSYVVPAQSTLRPLIVTWTCTVGAAARVNTSYVSVDGAASFDLPDLRADKAFANKTSEFPTQRLKDARWYAESRVEDFIGQCIVPRYFTCIRDGVRATYNLKTYRDEIQLPISDLRTVTTLAVDGVVLDPSDYTVYPWKIAAYPSVFGIGIRSVEIEGEQGMDYPPGDLLKATLTLAKHYLLTDVSTVPDRLQAMTNEFGTYQTNTANVGAPRYVSGHAGAPVAARPTGLPEVDTVLVQRGQKLPGMAIQ